MVVIYQRIPANDRTLERLTPNRAGRYIPAKADNPGKGRLRGGSMKGNDIKPVVVKVSAKAWAEFKSECALAGTTMEKAIDQFIRSFKSSH